MFSNLLSITQRPRLWQRSSEIFWDDEHISKYLLKMHLDPALELASRKKETITQSVKWLSTVIPAKSKILDLGCGPGLYAQKLSSLGHAVTGIDYSRRSIAYAKNHDKTTEYICQNYLEIDFENTYDVILLIYCDFAALTMCERGILLKKIHRALKPNGFFIFDVFTTSSTKAIENIPSWAHYPEGGFWSANPHLCLEAVYFYSDTRDNTKISVNQYVVILNDGIKEYLVWNTMYDLESLSEEMSANGFKTVEVLDNICGQPYTGKGDTLCFVVSKL